MVSIFDCAYRTVVRQLVFALTNPMTAHTAVLDLMRRSGEHQLLLSMLKAIRGSHQELSQTIHGTDFRSPVVLASGFLKSVDERVIRIMSLLGFGAVELGSFTLYPWDGNPGQTIWRLPKDGALINWQGLPGDGSAKAIQALCDARSFPCPIGISTAAMPSLPEGEDNLETFALTCEAFCNLSLVDYLVVNMGCPNHQHGTTYAQDHNLRHELMCRIRSTIDRKPLYVKLPGDVTLEDLEANIETAVYYGAKGLILANTSVSREGLRSQDLVDRYGIRARGGLSGRPLFNRTCQLVRTACKVVGGRLTIMASGGIFTAEDAYATIRLGASLTQILTGLVYQGPWIAEEINRGLVALLHRDGFRSIMEAVGSDNR